MFDLKPFRKGKQKADEWLEKFSRILENSPWFDVLINGGMVAKPQKNTFETDANFLENVDVDGALNVDGATTMEALDADGTCQLAGDPPHIFSTSSGITQQQCGVLATNGAEFLTEVDPTNKESFLNMRASFTGASSQVYARASAATGTHEGVVKVNGDTTSNHYAQMYVTQVAVRLQLYAATRNYTYLDPLVADGASAVAYVFDTTSLVTPGAKIASFRNNNSELAYVNYLGEIVVPRDSYQFLCGAGLDMSMYYDGTSGWINTKKVAASDLYLACGTDKTMVLEESVWNDLQFAIADGRVGVANFPDWSAFTTNTAEYEFDVDDYIDLAAEEVPHGWKEGTTGSVHLHLAIASTQSTGANRFAKFTVYIAYADVNEVWAEATPLSAEYTIPTGTAALTHYLLSMGNLTLTNQILGNQIKLRVKRIAATGGTEYADHVFITQAGIHLECDTVGSRTVSAK